MSQTLVPAIQKVRPEVDGLEIREVAKPELAPDEVLIEVQAAAICGSDLHLFQWDESIRGKLLKASSNFDRGLTIGHEFCGHVVELGSAVNAADTPQHGKISVGDFVSAESHVVCNKCYQCLRGEKHVCVDDKIIGFDRDGAFSRYIALPASCVWVNDKDLPVDLAAVQEPLGNAMHAATAFPLNGESVAVFGCGPIGLFSVAIAKAHGARKVIAVDVNELRLGFAKELGADVVHSSFEGASSHEDFARENARVVEVVKNLAGNDGPDVALEMSGNVGAINNVVSAVRRGGKVVFFGLPQKDAVTIDRFSTDLVFKGLSLQGVIGRRIYQTWEAVRDLLGDDENRQMIRSVISDVVPFGNYHDAFERMLKGKASKIVLSFEGAE